MIIPGSEFPDSVFCILYSVFCILYWLLERNLLSYI